MNENSKMTVLLGVRVPVDMKIRLDDAVRRVAYERRDSVTLAGLVREILDGWLAGEAS
jgi:hypothetical protein